MQRWFFADEADTCDEILPPTPVPSSSTISPVPSIHFERMWRLSVVVNEPMGANEWVAVTGDCDVLGNWQLSNCVIMTKTDNEADGNQWFVHLNLPRDEPVQYRYLIVALDPQAEKKIVRRWETHLTPHTLPPQERDLKASLDTFGVQEDEEKIDRGWLSCETILQLKFFNGPFTFKQRTKRRLVHVKVTPMHLKIPSTCEANLLATGAPLSPLEDSQSNDTHDTRENGTELSTTFAFNEVTTLCEGESTIKTQPQFGTGCSAGDLVIFHLTVGDFENTAYLIDLYTYSSRAALDEPPYHLGYHYVLPNALKRSEGLLDVPITCATRHRPMGMMQVGYLIVRPTPSLPLDMRVSFSRYWNDRWTGLDVGHRGLGTSFKTNDSVIRENTIMSLKNAVEHGADMVEFDVQLSKDLVPVVYHDFMIYVSLKAKNPSYTDFLALPVRELTLEQLKTMTVYHTEEGRSKEKRCFQDDDMQEHQPFPQLAEVLDAIDPNVGFNIEVKWSQKLKDGTMEEEFEHVVDRNLYLDCILDVVFRKAGSRRIVFSCFDPDICTMLRYKQNRYPVMFLTIGATEKFQKYFDPRGNTFEAAVYNSLAMELLGVVAHTEDLLRDPSQVNMAKNSGLVLFCWGDDNNSKDTIKLLKDLGLHAIIYDKMDQLTSKEIKTSVFQLQTQEVQSDLLKIQAMELGKNWHKSKLTKPSCSKLCHQHK